MKRGKPTREELIFLISILYGIIIGISIGYKVSFLRVFSGVIISLLIWGIFVFIGRFIKWKSK